MQNVLLCENLFRKRISIEYCKTVDQKLKYCYTTCITYTMCRPNET